MEVLYGDGGVFVAESTWLSRSEPVLALHV